VLGADAFRAGLHMEVVVRHGAQLPRLPGNRRQQSKGSVE
jgi:hypothetical protein